MTVANKLYPMFCIAKKIEEFASEMLLSVVDHIAASEDTVSEGPVALSKDVEILIPVLSSLPKDESPDSQRIADTLKGVGWIEPDAPVSGWIVAHRVRSACLKGIRPHRPSRASDPL
ncbi:hypothetical protein Taro_025505 [Colocasia esculenta]|uniref:Uncharacterized protein n=1 Tax=Colocasia esculenta TaxID=4460 RepID=A0A843VNH7_COLES|nr:hypothetical protein [Colocasia esculenta]